MSDADRKEDGRTPNMATASAPTSAQGDSERELERKFHTDRRHLPKGEFKKSHDDPATARKAQHQDHPALVPPSKRSWADEPGPIREKRQRG